MRGPRAVAILFVLVLLAGACSGDDDGGGGDAASEGESSVDEPAVEADCEPGREATAGTETAIVDHDGTERTYDLSIPESYDGETAAPLIVNMHGFSSNSTQQNGFTEMPEKAGDRGYIVMAPQAEPSVVPFPTGEFEATFWNVNELVDTSNDTTPDMTDVQDDIGFITTTVETLEDEFCVDASRIYMTGMSHGAAMTVALACVDDGRWAAAAPVGGSNFITECDPAVATPMLNIHGDADALAPYEGGGTLGFDLGMPTVIEQTTRFAVLGGCGEEAELEKLGDDVELRTWSGCDDGIDVQLYTVLGGGHTWPGGTLTVDIDPEAVAGEQVVEGEFFGLPLSDILGETTDTIVATDLILDFFDAHTNA